jgi:hypothetical protein
MQFQILTLLIVKHCNSNCDCIRLHNLFNYNILNSRLQYLNFTIAFATTTDILVADPTPHPYVLDCNGATGSILTVIWLQYDLTCRPTERPARLLVVTQGRLQLV